MSRVSAKSRKASAPLGQASEISRHLVRAQEEERKRIGRELHDGTGQGLMVLRLYLGMLGAGSLDSEAQFKVQEALGLLDNTIEDLRRIIGRLSPQTLERLGLLPAIRKEVREISRNSGIKAALDLPRSLGAVDLEIELALYRSVQEALHNIAKHSQAKNFRVRLQATHETLHLLVEDDGIGFSKKKISQGNGFGLWGMRERVAALGGKVRVNAHPDKGTQLRVTLPTAAGPEAGVAGRSGSRLISTSELQATYSHAH